MAGIVRVPGIRELDDERAEELILLSRASAVSPLDVVVDRLARLVLPLDAMNREGTLRVDFLPEDGCLWLHAHLRSTWTLQRLHVETDGLRAWSFTVAIGPFMNMLRDLGSRTRRAMLGFDSEHVLFGDMVLRTESYADFEPPKVLSSRGTFTILEEDFQRVVNKLRGIHPGRLAPLFFDLREGIVGVLSDEVCGFVNINGSYESALNEVFSLPMDAALLLASNWRGRTMPFLVGDQVRVVGEVVGILSEQSEEKPNPLSQYIPPHSLGCRVERESFLRLLPLRGIVSVVFEVELFGGKAQLRILEKGGVVGTMEVESVGANTAAMVAVRAEHLRWAMMVPERDVRFSFSTRGGSTALIVHDRDFRELAVVQEAQ